MQISSEDSEKDREYPDVVDNEDTSRSDDVVKPWDPGKIRITTKNFTLRELVDQIDNDEIDLAPDFQRDYVWKTRQRTRLIESILLGIPLPAFYFNQEKDGTYQVVDGVQRLSTITLFMHDLHTLDKHDLEYLHGMHGLTFSALDTAANRRFRSTQIVVHVIEPQTPDDVKYDIFSRVNTLGSPLSAQEIRHAMSKARSRKLLTKLSELQEFDEATERNYWRRDPSIGEDVRDSGRMTNRELVLRFCAFRNFSADQYRQHSSLDAFLVQFTRKIDGTSDAGGPVSDVELKNLEDDFSRAMFSAHQILGRAAFRRWPIDQARRGPINRAVFESQAIALADYETSVLTQKSAEIEHAFRLLFSNVEYARAVTVATGDVRAVETRLTKTREALARIIHD